MRADGRRWAEGGREGGREGAKRGGGGRYREEGVDDVGLDGAQRLVSDHDEDLLLFLQADEVTEPRLLGKSVDGGEGFRQYLATLL